MRALSFLERLVAYEGNRQTVEQLLDAGEQLLLANQRIQDLADSIKQARLRRARHVAEYRRQWQTVIDRLEQPIISQRQIQRRMGSLVHQNHMQRWQLQAANEHGAAAD